MENKWYVTMTDSFMSGWGLSKNKTNKLVVECDSLQDAEVVCNNAKLREEMQRIKICKNKPSYNIKQYLTSHKHYNELGELWKK